MMGWLDDGMIRLDEMSKEVKNGEIKQQIMRHKEFQKELGEKQPMYDSTMKTNKGLIGEAPKTDEPIIKIMVIELKNKWKEKDKDKDYTFDLAKEMPKEWHTDVVQAIQHWVTIIQLRWDEVA